MRARGGAFVVLALAVGCGRTTRNPIEDEVPVVGGTSSGGTSPTEPPGGSAGTPSPAASPDCAIALASYDSRYCAVYQDGSVWCWGYRIGQVFPTTFKASDEPLQVKNLENVERVALGPVHSCAITSGGELFCWGDNESGQIDRGLGTPVEMAQLFVEASEVGLGRTQTCVAQGTELTCWGTDDAGQTAGPFERYLDLPAAGVEGAMLPSVTTDFSDAQGRVWDLGTWATPKERSELGTDNRWHSFGHPETCLLKRSGSLWCNNYIFDDNDSALYTKLELGEHVVQAGTGEMFSCALTDDGRVWCEGFDAYGQTGRGTMNTFNGGAFTALKDVTTLAVGRTSACVLTVDGRVQCWGSFTKDRQSNAPVEVSGCRRPDGRHALERPKLGYPAASQLRRFEQASRARGQAVCDCGTMFDDATRERCVQEEDFSISIDCVLGLDPQAETDPYWACVTEQRLQEAECFRQCQDIAACLPMNDCGTPRRPDVLSQCRD